GGVERGVDGGGPAGGREQLPDDGGGHGGAGERDVRDGDRCGGECIGQLQYGAGQVRVGERELQHGGGQVRDGGERRDDGDRVRSEGVRVHLDGAGHGCGGAGRPLDCGRVPSEHGQLRDERVSDRVLCECTGLRECGDRQPCNGVGGFVGGDREHDTGEWRVQHGGGSVCGGAGL